MERKPYALEVEALDLGEGIKATGLELVETESREPVTGAAATEIWAALLPALAASDFHALDFFSHLDRVRESCQAKGISFREEAGRCLVIPQPLPEQLSALLARFAAETFGVRAGEAAREGDRALEEELSRRGVDAYQGAYPRYAFCAVCELDSGWVTLLSEKLWTSEILRRVRKPLEQLDVQVARLQ
jgi:hypothetical protein